MCPMVFELCMMNKTKENKKKEEEEEEEEKKKKKESRRRWKKDNKIEIFKFSFLNFWVG